MMNIQTSFLKDSCDLNQVVKVLKNLNNETLKAFVSVKQEYSRKNIANNQISNFFKASHGTFNSIVLNNLAEIANADQNGELNQKEILAQLSRRFRQKQQFLEVMRCLTSTIQMIKQFIKIKAIKDPTTAVPERQIKQIEAEYQRKNI